MRIDVVTIFPRLFEAFAEAAFVGIARERGALALQPPHELEELDAVVGRALRRHRSACAPTRGGKRLSGVAWPSRLATVCVNELTDA